MKFRIHWIIKEHQDSIVLEGPNIAHITKQVEEVITKRGLHSAEQIWSEELAS